MSHLRSASQPLIVAALFVSPTGNTPSTTGLSSSQNPSVVGGSVTLKPGLGWNPPLSARFHNKGLKGSGPGGYVFGYV